MSKTPSALTIHQQEFLEFSLGVGCPIRCPKYCPQEITIQRYKSQIKMMTSEVFKTILANTPKVPILIFAGYYEPALNPHFVDMVEYAHEKGYTMAMNTTVWGLTFEQTQRLLKIPFEQFCIHMWDGVNCNFPLTERYMTNFFMAVKNAHNSKGERIANFSLMNDLFVSNNRENVTRGKLGKYKRLGWCQKRVVPQFVVLPNGDVQLCCMDFGLWHRIGNLLTEKYEVLRERFYHEDYKLCHYCQWNIPYSRYLLKETAKKVWRKLWGD